MRERPLEPENDCMHCRVPLSVPLRQHLADCPLRVMERDWRAVRSQGPPTFRYDTESIPPLPPREIDGQASFPVNGVHFIGWDQHAARCVVRPTDTREDLGGTW